MSRVQLTIFVAGSVGYLGGDYGASNGHVTCGVSFATDSSQESY